MIEINGLYKIINQVSIIPKSESDPDLLYKGDSFFVLEIIQIHDSSDGFVSRVEAKTLSARCGITIQICAFYPKDSVVDFEKLT